MRLFKQQATATAPADTWTDEESQDPLVVARAQLDRFASERAAREEALRSADEAHRAQMEALVADRDARIAALTADRDTRIAILIAERDNTVAEVAADRDTRVAAIAADRDAQVATIVADRDSRIAALLQEHLAAVTASDEERAREREEAQQRFAELEGRTAAIIAELRSELTALRSERAEEAERQRALVGTIEQIASSQLCSDDETDQFAIGANNTAVLVLDALDDTEAS